MSTATESRPSGSAGRRGGGRRGSSQSSQGSRGGAGGRRKNNTDASRPPPAATKLTPEERFSRANVEVSLAAGAAGLTLDAAKVDDEATADATSTEADTDICWLCAEPVKFHSVSECNHRTCHVCAVRLRALYKKMECTFCKNPQPKVIFTESSSRPWEEYTSDMIPYTDDKLKISFETDDMVQETLFLLGFNCPESECTYTGTGWADLKWHVRDTHGLLLCDLCIRHKKIFAHEHSLYTPKLLLQHLPSTRRPPIMPQYKSKDLDKGKVAGGGKDMTEVDSVHPFCSFCRECFYGDDELYAHLRERHEACFVCKRMGIRDVYFQNYDKLDEHFQSEHFPCPHASCLEQKFVVFPSAMDLQAHQLEAHGQTMGTRERKEKMRVDAGFTFEDIRSGRSRNGNASTSNSITPTPGLGARRAAFGGALTSASAEDQQDEHADVVLQTSDLTPLQQHLRNLTTSAQFQVISSVRSYRASECSAAEMLDTVFGVFDRNLDVMGSVVTKILDVFEDNEEKKAQLLVAWNGLKVEERNQFPSLAPVASNSQAGWAGIASGRAVNLKKTSQRPSSNHQTARRVWDRVEQAALSSGPPPSLLSSMSRNPQSRPALQSTSLSSSAFPSLTAAAIVPGSTAHARAAAQRATPWASSGPHTPPPPSAQPAAPAPTLTPFSVSAPVSSTRAQGAPTLSQFPSLQTSSAARLPAPREFLSGNQSIRNIRGEAPAPTRPAWGAAGNSSNEVSTSNTGSEGSNANGGAGRGKKKKKGREKLFTFGAYAS